MELERFPVHVRWAIKSLFAQPPEVIKKRDVYEQSRSRVIKLSKIPFLEDYLISATWAQIPIPLIWQTQAPFCLFLRSFSMGHLSGQVDTSGKSKDEDILEWLDNSEPVGGRLLSLLSNTLQDQAALLAISNPNEWLPHRLVSGPFANLVVKSETWHEMVTPLIKASQLIVVHRAEASPGLDFELENIRSIGRMDATIVVRDPPLAAVSDIPINPWLEMLDRVRRRKEARNAALDTKFIFPPDPALDGFQVIEWRSDDYVKEKLLESVTHLLQKDTGRIFGSLPPFNLPEASPEQQFQYQSYARQCYELAGRYRKMDDLWMAEELLYATLAASCAGDDIGGRASAYLDLGKLYLLQLGDAEAAAVPLEYASGHFGTIPGAADYALEAFHLYAAARLLCGNLDAAQAILEETKVWKHTRTNYEWQLNLWHKIKTRSTNKDILLFATEISHKLTDTLERLT
ncbi:MAG TPA: hypothetical protein PK228_15810 [Saprospiraceae bacterium]|nr:hypothetical protein [Saprospiraceae bacterium]